MLWSYFKKGSESCGVVSKYVLCYFKKAAWREEIEPSFLKELCPLMEVKGGPFPTFPTQLTPCNGGYDIFLPQMYSSKWFDTTLLS